MQFIKVERQGGVATVLINRPDKYNALSPEVFLDMAQVFPALEADNKVKAVVITGAGPAFCAGGDLNTLKSIDPISSRKLLTDQRSWVRPIIEMEKPVIAAVNGIVAGAGLSLVLLCDYVIAAASATFRSAFTAVGAVPDLGLAWLLPKAVGNLRAKEIFMKNEILSAQRAAEIGLVNTVVADADFAERVKQEAEAFAASITPALGLTKFMLNKACEMDIFSFLDVEAMVQAQAFAAPETQQAVAEMLAVFNQAKENR